MKTNQLITPDWLIADGMRTIQAATHLSALLPRCRRVKRRGFRLDVRRGDVIRHQGKRWNVVRRSNWNLWLYEVEEMTVGTTIQIKTPKRFSAAG